MPKPIITDIDLLDESTDKEHRLTQTFKVQGINLNVESLQVAFTTNVNGLLPGKTIWKEGAVNPYMKGDPTNATIASDISVSRNGKNENVFDVRIAYAPRDEFNAQLTRKKDIKFRYPWEEDAEYNEDGQTVTVDYWGTDERGQPLQYSNGQNVQLQKDLPLVVISITRQRRADDNVPSPALRRAYYQAVNNNTVNITIAGISTAYDPRTLLVSGFPIQLKRFKKIDPITGKVTTIPYFTESITLIGRGNTWATRIPDQGSFYRDGADRKRFINKKTAVVEDTDLLNGQGEQLLKLGEADDSDDYDGSGNREILNPYANQDFTPQGVRIDDNFTNGLSGRMVMLAFLTYEEKNFNDLMLNLRL